MNSILKNKFKANKSIFMLYIKLNINFKNTELKNVNIKIHILNFINSLINPKNIQNIQKL